MKDEFTITSLSREDLKHLGYDITNVSDDIMEGIASRLEDDYCEQLFWTSLDIIASERFNIPKKEK